MNQAALPQRSWLPVAVGGYAALAAILPYPVRALAAAGPVAVFGAGWLLGRPHRWITAFLLAALLLPPLPVAIGDSGPHPAVLVAALGGLAGLVQWRLWHWPAIPAWALLRLWGVMLLSLIPATFYYGPDLAAASLARALLFGIAVYLFCYLTGGPGAPALDSAFSVTRLLYAAGVAAALFACLDFYFQWPAPAGFAEQFVWLESGVVRRAQGLFYEASTLGNACAFFLTMAAAGLWLGQASPVPRRWLLAGSCVFAAALAFSYSRASIVAVAVALVAMLLCRRSRLPWRPLAALAAVATLAIASVAYLRPEFASQYGERLGASASLLFTSPDRILSGRVTSWQTLLDFIAAQPQHLILGVGYKTLPYGGLLDRPVVGDNAYLSALVEMGLPGLLALLLLHAAVLRTAWRAAHCPDPRAAFFGLWIFGFWCGEVVQMLSGDLLTYWRVLPLYFWVLAMALLADREHSLR